MSLKEKGNVRNALTRTNTLCTVMMYPTTDIECVIYFGLLEALLCALENVHVIEHQALVLTVLHGC